MVENRVRVMAPSSARRLAASFALYFNKLYSYIAPKTYKVPLEIR